MKKGLLLCFVSVFIVWGGGLPSAVADVGDFGLPYWGMVPGNSWDYDYTNPGGGGTQTQIVQLRDTTTFPFTTFLVNSYEGMVLRGQTWFSVTLQELRLHQLVDANQNTYRFDPGVILMKNPNVPGAVENQTISVTVNGFPIPVSVPAVTTVQNPESVTVPQGTWMAQKASSVITIPIYGTITETHWFVPYLGFLKAEETLGGVTETATLTGFNVKKWVVDYENAGYTPLSAYHLPTNQLFSEDLGNLGQYGWNMSESMPLAWDYDGDGITDESVYHIPSNQWFVKGKGIFEDNLGQYGWNGDECIPVPGDYDGDGVMERAFYHWPTNRWFVEGQTPVDFGYDGAASIPIAGDYDGDGKTDMMLYHVDSNQWFVHGIGALGQFGWGGADCIPVPGDWNGDGKTEIAVYYMPDNEWVWRDAGGTAQFMGQFGWGGAESFPIPGDIEGTGSFLRAFYRPLENRWFVDGLGDMVWGWGGAEFMPVMGQLPAYNWFRFRLGMFQ